MITRWQKVVQVTCTSVTCIEEQSEVNCDITEEKEILVLDDDINEFIIIMFYPN